MDVFSIGDLGVQRGFMNYVSARSWLQEELKSVNWSEPLAGTHSPGKSDKAKNRKPATVSKTVKSFGGSAPVHKQMEWIANKFKPYQSVFQMILWKLSNIDLDVLEKK